MGTWLTNWTYFPTGEDGDKKTLAGSGRKTTHLRSIALRRGKQVRASEGPPFAKASARQAIQAGKRQVVLAGF